MGVWTLDAEVGTDGVAITGPNSAWDAVTIGVGGSATFSAAAAKHGALGYRLVQASSTATYLRFDQLAGESGPVMIRGTFSCTAIPTGTPQFLYLTNTANAAIIALVAFNSAGQAIIQASGTTILTSTLVIQPDTEYHFELVVDAGTTTTNGVLGFGMVEGKDNPIVGTTNDATQVYVYRNNVNTGTTGVGRIQLGKINSTWACTQDIDDVLVVSTRAFTSDPATWLGPYSGLPQVRQGTVGTVGTQATSEPVTKPSVLSGDLLLGFHAGDDAAPTTITGSTFTQIESGNSPGGAGAQVQTKTWQRITDGSEPSSFTFNWAASVDIAGGLLSIFGVDPTTPVADIAAGTGTATSMVAPSVAGVAGGLLVTCWYVRGDATTTRKITSPASMADAIEVKSDWVQFLVAVERLDVAGATGTRTATFPISAAYRAVSIVVAPPPPDPTVRDVQALTSGANSATGIFITHTAPVDVAVGDQLSVMMMLREAPSLLTGWRVPTGWTEREAPVSSGQGYLYTAEYGVDVFGTSWTWDNGAGNTTGSRWASVMTTLKGDVVGDYLGSVSGADTGTPSNTPSLVAGSPVGAMVAGFGSRTTGGVTWSSWSAGWREIADTATQVATNAVTAGVAVTDAVAAGTYSVQATPSISVVNGVGFLVAYRTSAPPEVTGALSMAASSGFAIGGSLSRALTLAMDAVDGFTVGAVRSQPASLSLAAAGALTVAGVKSRLSVLPMDAIGDAFTIAGSRTAVAVLPVAGLGTFDVVDLSQSLGVVAARATPAMTVGALRQQLAVLPVAGISGLAIGTLYTRFGTLVVAATSSFVPNTGASAVFAPRGTPVLVINTTQGFLRVLAVRGTPAMLVGAVLIGDYHPNRRVTAVVLDHGLRQAVLIDAAKLARLLSPSYGAVITRGS